VRVSCGKMRLAPFGLNFAALPWGSDQRVQARLSFPIRPDFPEADLGPIMMPRFRPGAKLVRDSRGSRSLRVARDSDGAPPSAT
jgi:hypothetical protein